MDKKHKIGRNEPCPCGSGKKYKRCCGAERQTDVRGHKEIDHFKLNKEIAYKGKIGRMREEFCKKYILRKQAAFQVIEQGIKKQTKALDETITCHKGCFFCCSQYIGASIQECEAIVYYLYHHENLFADFLRAYPKWRADVRKNESLFQRIGQLYNKAGSGFAEETESSLMRESDRYLAQNIPCPFLRDGMCSIYEVRPWACASVVATSPAEWCSSSNPNKPRIYTVYSKWNKEVPLYGKSTALVFSPLPVGIHNILIGGTAFLSKIPGLENLENEALSDSEVRPIIQRYLKSH